MQSSDVPDAWFTGYTTQYTVAVWTGYKERTTPIKSRDQRIAQLIFKDVMGHVSKSVNTPDFKQPKSVVRAAVEVGTNPAMQPSPTTPNDQIVQELFVRGTEPKEISKKYDVLEVPKNLKALYKKGTDGIKLTWEYGDIEGVQFEVSEIGLLGIKQILSTINVKELIVPGHLLGNNGRTFQVIAISGDRRSEPASVVVQGLPDDNTKNEDKNDQEVEDGQDQIEGHDDQEVNN